LIDIFKKLFNPQNQGHRIIVGWPFIVYQEFPENLQGTGHFFKKAVKENPKHSHHPIKKPNSLINGSI
jgi:hypothetical protein